MKDPYESIKLEKLPPVRQLIADAMEKSSAVPTFHLFRTIEMDALLAARPAGRPKPTITACLLRLITRALAEDGRLNGIFKDGCLGLSRDINLGVAMAAPMGLTVPVIRDATALNALQWHEELLRLGGAIKMKKLSPDVLYGGTFTFTNLGMYGIDRFVPLLNPPQICILAAGCLRDKIKHDGKTSRIIEFTLSADHRVVDGSAAAEFLQRLAGLVESCAEEDLIQ